MLSALAAGVLALASLCLFVWGLNVLYLSLRSLRLKPVRLPPVPAGTERDVCVQLPLYDELYVAERVIDAACRLDWPADRLEIQVLDDSDDATADVVAAATARWRARGVRIEHIRRQGRAGYKAGALAHGLGLTRAPYIAVFDADFVPPPDFLRRIMGAFQDPEVGFAQARWGHLNRGYSWLTRLQALSIDFHFLVEQAVRSAAGHLTNFTGTAGVWRRAAIEDAGGWSAATLTEDLDLSYRAQLRGWKPVLVSDLVVPEELPASLDAYLRQQSRWATGSFQCARLLLGPVMRSRFRAATKFQALMHLLAYGGSLVMLVQLACYPLLLIGQAIHQPLPALLPIAIWLNLVSVAPWLGVMLAQWRNDGRWWRGLPGLACQMVGAGISIVILVALVASAGGSKEFVRTAKFGLGRPGEEWRNRRYVHIFRPVSLANLVVGIAALTLVAPAVRSGQGLIALYSCLFGLGLIAVGGYSVVEALEVLVLRGGRLRDVGALRRSGSAVVLIGLTAVLLAGMAQLPDPFEDSYHHWLIAANLAQTGHLQDPLFGMEDSWLPGFHLLAAGVLKIAGLWQIGALKLVDAALSLATLEMVRRIAGGGRRGFLAVALMALSPVFLLTATSVVAEPLLTACLTASALAAVRGRMAPAAAFAMAACFTGTKAWIWVVAVLAGLVLERVLSRPPSRLPVPRIAWALPAVAFLVLLQLGFAPASHSVARAAVEVTSATARGSLAAGPALRGLDFGGNLALALLPLLALAPLGLWRALREPKERSRFRFLYLPALVYLAVVIGLVTAGVYTGSHRYLLPALPGLAALAALGLDRAPASVRLTLVAAAALLAVGYLPVFTSLSAGNDGLIAAGRAARSVPGRLLTDSPVAAYFSGKPPSEVSGSRSLPGGRDAAVAWLRAGGYGPLVLEGIDYYRASQVFPELAQGQVAAPFQALGNPAAYTVAGGKPVYAYRIGS